MKYFRLADVKNQAQQRLFTFLSIALCVMACREPVPHINFDNDCNQQESDRLAKFIIECATAANPKSDEEGEDLVMQCQRTGEQVLCPRVAFVGWSNDKYYSDRQRCDETQESAFVTICQPYVGVK